MSNDADDLCILMQGGIPLETTSLAANNNNIAVRDDVCILDEDIPAMSELPNVLGLPVTSGVGDVTGGDVTVWGGDEVDGRLCVLSDEFVWADDPVAADESCILQEDTSTKLKKKSKHEVTKANNQNSSVHDDPCIIADKSLLLKNYSSLSSFEADDIPNGASKIPSSNILDDDFTEFQTADDTENNAHLSSAALSSEAVADVKGSENNFVADDDKDETCILKVRVKKRDLKLDKDGDNKCLLRT